jgi:hypothetical protein
MRPSVHLIIIAVGGISKASDNVKRNSLIKEHRLFTFMLRTTIKGSSLEE